MNVCVVACVNVVEIDKVTSDYMTAHWLGPLRAFETPPSIVLWLRLAEDYTKRHLTKASDRLHAISGLASSMNDYQWGKYVAGMWEKGLGDTDYVDKLSSLGGGGHSSALFS